MVKGLKSMWRQAPPIVRNTLQGVLARIIMQARTKSKHSTTVSPGLSTVALTLHVTLLALSWSHPFARV